MPEIKPFIPIETIKHKTGAMPSVPVVAAEANVPRETPLVEAKPETPVPVVAEKPKEEILDSERFAAITKKERAIQKRARELQEREQRIAKWEEAEKLVPQDKLEAIKRLGITYDDLTNLHLSRMGAEDTTPEAIAARKAQEITKAEIEAFKKQEEARQAQYQQEQYQAAKTQIQNEAVTFTNAKPEEFAYTNLESAHDIIVELIEQTYFDTGRLMPVSEAAGEVEKFLEAKYEKLSQLPKFRSKYLGVAQDSKPLETSTPVQTQKPQTLTHRDTVAPPRPRVMTQEERRQRAIKIAMGLSAD